MHFPALGIIHECGLTELGGRPHNYRHERQSDAYVIGLSLAGTTRLSIGDQHAILKAPALGCARPGVVYEIASIPPHDNRGLYVLITQPARWQPVDFPEALPGYGHLPLTGHPYLTEITEAFRSLYRWTRTFVPMADALAINALERALLLASVPDFAASKTRDDRLHGLTGHICMHMAEVLDVPTLAAHAGMSPSRFAHLFRRTFGITPMAYVERVRMEEAKALLATGTLPIKRIAQLVGYDRGLYFSRRFRRAMGCSPSVWRTRAKEGT
jgi:AraC family transcriptional regulator of arabinose operon